MNITMTWEQELSELATSAEEAAAFYEGAPGLVGHGAVVDLYRTVARLAELMLSTQTKAEGR